MLSCWRGFVICSTAITPFAPVYLLAHKAKQVSPNLKTNRLSYILRENRNCKVIAIFEEKFACRILFRMTQIGYIQHFLFVESDLPPTTIIGWVVYNEKAKTRLLEMGIAASNILIDSESYF